MMQQDFWTLTDGEEGGMKLTFNGVYFSRHESRFNVITGADPGGSPTSCIQRRLLHHRITVQLGSMGGDGAHSGAVTHLAQLISDHGSAPTLSTGP